MKCCLYLLRLKYTRVQTAEIAAPRIFQSQVMIGKKKDRYEKSILPALSASLTSDKSSSPPTLAIKGYQPHTSPASHWQHHQ